MQGSFAVQPQLGLLHGNEQQTVTWTFVPADKATYDVSVTCMYDSPQDTMPDFPAARAGLPQTALVHSAAALSKGRSQQLGVRLVGQGTVGALTLEPSTIDFGTVAVGFPAVRDITLLNHSGGNLCYAITCTAVPVGEAALTLTAAESAPASQDSLTQPDASQRSSPGAESPEDDSALHLVIEEPQGYLPARATKTLRLTLNPTSRKQYNLQLVCRTATAAAPGVQNQSTALSTVALPAKLSAPPVCASIGAFSTYPTVIVTDIACQGLDKPFVWNQMSCSQINTELAAEMTEVCCRLNSLCTRSHAFLICCG